MPATVIAGAPRRRLGGAAEEVARALLGRPFIPYCANRPDAPEN
ncbi:MAG TPA: hypothetical protein VKB64_00600 [Gaiellaceae bacterium]|nr:hypothetical protein [Gaiellaceae bacterium]